MLTSKIVGKFVDSKGGVKRKAKAVTGRLIEEVVELALSCGLTTGEIFGHVADSLHNQSLKASTEKTIAPSRLTDSIENVVGEIADVSIITKDLAYVLKVDLPSAEQAKWNEFIKKDFHVTESGLIYAKKPHYKT